MADQMSPARVRRARGVARRAGVVVVGLLLAAGCGDDDSEGDGVSGGDAPIAADTDVSSVRGSDGTLDCPARAATSGEPVKVGVVSTSASIGMELDASSAAAGAYANDCLGGVAGHPLELVYCDEPTDDAATATACASQLIDEGVDAAAITLTTMGETLVPMLTEAGIPYVTSGATSPAESNDDDDMVFSLTSGGAGVMGAMARYAQDTGIGKVGLVVTESVAASGLAQLANIPFAHAGVEFEVLPVPDVDADWAAAAQALADDSDALAALGDAAMCAGLAGAASTLGLDVELLLVVTCAQPAAIEQLGAEVFEGAKVFGNYDTQSDHPEAVLYREVMAAYAPDAAAEQGLTVSGYQVVTGLVRALDGATGDLDRDGIVATLRTTTDVAVPAGAGATFGCSADPIPLISASCSGDAIVLTMDGGMPLAPEALDISALFSL